MEIKATFTKDEFEELVYAAREAQIRFKRLRKAVRNGDSDVSHWTEQDCDDQMQRWVYLEETLTARFEEATGQSWY